MDGWPQEISEHNDQSLMNSQNINDGTQLRGFLSVDAFQMKSETPRATLGKSVALYFQWREFSRCEF